MEIHHLRYFVAVAEEQSFVRAAERLHMAASPLSRRVRDLEDELGVQLLVRQPQKVALTPAGSRLLFETVRLLDHFDSLPGIVHEEGAEPIRTAVVGFSPEVSPPLRSSLMKEVTQAHRNLTLQVVSASSAPLTKSLIKGDLDLAFVQGRVTDPALRSVRVESQQVGVVVAERLGFDQHESIRLRELRHLPYASLPEEAAPFVYRATDNWLLRHGIRGRISLQTNNQADLVPIVAAGQAFTICGLEFGATHKLFTAEPVKLLPVHRNPIQLATYAAWRSDSYAKRSTVRDVVDLVNSFFTPFLRE